MDNADLLALRGELVGDGAGDENEVVWLLASLEAYICAVGRGINGATLLSPNMELTLHIQRRPRLYSFSCHAICA